MVVYALCPYRHQEMSPTDYFHCGKGLLTLTPTRGYTTDMGRVNLFFPPSIRGKITDTFSHTFFSLLYLIIFKPGVKRILVFNSANSPICLLPKIFGKRVFINVDGLEWKRAKWGPLARTYYRFAEFFSTLVADEIIADSREIKRYYLSRFGRSSVFIPYGTYIEESEKPEILKEYGLKKDGYFFTASRLEPENNADLTVKAFEGLNTDKFLVIAGGANYKSRFVQKIKETKDKRIKFLGPIYKPGHIKELHFGCYAYIHGNEVGGTNPALLKALGFGNSILALDVPFNKEVVAKGAILYEKRVDDLRRKMDYLLKNPEVVTEYRKKARERARDYNWDDVASAYEKVLG